MRAGVVRLRAASVGKARASPIVGEWDGSGTASAPSVIGPGAGERRMNVAVPSESNLNLRLSHELQTAMGGSAERGRNFALCSRHGATLFQRLYDTAGARRARGPAVLIIEGIGGFAPASAPCLSEHDSDNIWPRSGSKATSASLPSSFSFLGEPIRRTVLQQDLPDALTRHNRDLSPSASSS